MKAEISKGPVFITKMGVEVPLVGATIFDMPDYFVVRVGENVFSLDRGEAKAYMEFRKYQH